MKHKKIEKKGVFQILGMDILWTFVLNTFVHTTFTRFKLIFPYHA